jgi:putative intracellular protease/amidase
LNWSFALLTRSGNSCGYLRIHQQRRTSMSTIVIILTEGFADWETTLLGAVARGFYKAEVKYAAPGGKSVTSTGGMKVTPNLALEDVDVRNLDALVVCGGEIWQTPKAPDLGSLLHAAHDAGKVIGAICDGTVATARTGLLDGAAHTSNGAGYLDKAIGYRGAAKYRDVPHAVVDQKIVTAAATAPVSFMQAVMKAIGLGDDQLDYHVSLHARQFDRQAKAA